jgi:hypothetical protein
MKTQIHPLSVDKLASDLLIWQQERTQARAALSEWMKRSQADPGALPEFKLAAERYVRVDRVLGIISKTAVDVLNDFGTCSEIGKCRFLIGANYYLQLTDCNKVIVHMCAGTDQEEK